MGSYNYIFMKKGNDLCYLESKLSEDDISVIRDAWSDIEESIVGNRIVEDKHQTKYTVGEISLLQNLQFNLYVLFEAYPSHVLILLGRLEEGYKITEVVSEYDCDIIPSDATPLV